jgi:hypothetical protein
MQSALRGGDLYELLKDGKGNRALLHPHTRPSRLRTTGFSSVSSCRLRVIAMTECLHESRFSSAFAADPEVSSRIIPSD